MKKLIIIVLIVIVGLVVCFALRRQLEGQPTVDHLAGRSNTRITDSNNANSKLGVSAYDTPQSLSKASSIEQKHIEPLESDNLSSIDDELAELVLDEVAKRIQYIENHGGIFSRAALVHPSIQEALFKSEEYRKGVELHVLVEDHQKNNETQEADRIGRLAAKHFLNAATQHLRADISICTLRAGYILTRMNQPDAETAYLLLKYTQVINPKGNVAIFSNTLINDEIKEKNLLTQEKMQELDKRVDKMQSLAEVLENENILRTFRDPNSLPIEE